MRTKPTRNFKTRRIAFGYFAHAVCACLIFGVAQAAEPIVIGMSAPTSGPRSTTGARMVAGAQSYVEHVNALGGIRGRRLSLVVLDDAGRANQTEENIRSLAQKGAIAILGCAGDEACASAAKAAGAARLPLVAPLSGLNLTEAAGGMAFAIRASHDKEAEAMARQLHGMGFTRMVIVSERNGDSPREQAIRKALAVQGITWSSITLDRKNLPALEQALNDARKGAPQAAWVEATSRTIEAMMDSGAAAWPVWPGTIVSLSGESMTRIAGAFEGRTIVFTSVVPNPEYLALKVTADFNAQAGRYAPDGEATTFEGFETYLGARTLVEALRRAGSTPDRTNLLGALRGLRDVDFGGFTVSFADNQSFGSHWVETGMRTKQGVFIR